MVILLMQIRDCSTGHTFTFFTYKEILRMLMRTGLEAVDIRMAINGVSQEDREFVSKLMELSEVSDESMFYAYQYLLQARCADGKKCVTERFWKAGMEEAQELNLRKACRSDCKFLFRLRNEDEVRKNSFQTSEIPYSSHENWFAQNCRMSIQLSIF